MTQFKVDFNDFKRRDNTNLMEITLYKDSGEQITPNRDHQWSGKALKFGDGDKRLEQELAVTIDGDKIGVPSKQLENLPSGDYGLELWETSNDSKTIYPSAGFVEFHIHRNADESLESVTPTIDINKVIDDLHQAGLNVVVDDIEMLAPDATPSVTSEVRDGKNHIKLHIPRGLKGDVGPAPTLKIGTVTKLNPDQTPTANFSGDNGSYTLDLGIPQGSTGATGTVDNAGLINAPAFQALQTQVNSLMGDPDNLIIGGDFEDQRDYIGQASPYWGTNATIVDNVDKNQDINKSNTVLQINGLLTKNQDVISKNLIAVRQSEYSIELKTRWSNTDQLGSIVIYAFEYDDNKDLIAPRPVIYDSVQHNWKIITGTYKPSSSAVKYMKFDITYANAKSTLPVWVDDIHMSLNAEILTQSDYAKIKAAIVALGGSLS